MRGRPADGRNATLMAANQHKIRRWAEAGCICSWWMPSLYYLQEHGRHGAVKNLYCLFLIKSPAKGLAKHLETSPTNTPNTPSAESFHFTDSSFLKVFYVTAGHQHNKQFEEASFGFGKLTYLLILQINEPINPKNIIILIFNEG